MPYYIYEDEGVIEKTPAVPFSWNILNIINIPYTGEIG